MAVSHVYNQTVADGTATSVVRPSNWNSAHNQFMTLSGNTAGASTVSGTNIVFQGGGNVTLSVNAQTIIFDASNCLTTAAQSNHSHGNPTLNLTNISGTTASNSNGLTLSLSAAAGGGAAIDFWEPFGFGNNTSYSSFGQNTVYMQPVIPQVNVNVSAIEMNASISFVSSSNSQAVSNTFIYGLYGHDVAADTYTQIATSNFIVICSYNSNTAAGITLSNSAGSFTTTSGGTAIFTAFSGPKFMYFPFTTTLSAGVEYAVAIKASSASAVNTGPLRMSMQMLTNHTVTSVGKLKVDSYTAAQTNLKQEYDFQQYSATSSNLAGTLTKSQFQPVPGKPRMYIFFENEA